MTSKEKDKTASGKPEKEAFGNKTIGFVGGVALLCNNATGSAMVLFPALVQEAGWLVVLLGMILIAFLSMLCGLMLLEAISRIPGNQHFTQRIEYTDCSKYFLSPKWNTFITIVFQMSLILSNMAMIIQSAQVMDFTLVAIFGRSCTIPEFYPSAGFRCPEHAQMDDISPFGDSVYALTLGFVLIAVIVVPFGYWNLDDNIYIQEGAFVILWAIVACWIAIFCRVEGLVPKRAPVVGTEFANVLGVTIFNFAIINSVPSWANEKHPSVSVAWSFTLTMGLASVMYFCLGLIGAMAYAPWWDTSQSDENILDKLQKSSSVLAHVTFYVFPVVANLTSIPIYSIITRYNLIQSGLLGPAAANFVGVVLPWLVSVVFYTGQGFNTLITWAGVLVNSLVNFIFPPVLYIAAISMRPDDMRPFLRTPFFERARGPDSEIGTPSSLSRGPASPFKSSSHSPIEPLSPSASQRNLRQPSSGGSPRENGIVPRKMSSRATPQADSRESFPDYGANGTNGTNGTNGMHGNGGNGGGSHSPSEEEAEHDDNPEADGSPRAADPGARAATGSGSGGVLARLRPSERQQQKQQAKAKPAKPTQQHKPHKVRRVQGVQADVADHDDAVEIGTDSDDEDPAAAVSSRAGPLLMNGKGGSGGSSASSSKPQASGATDMRAPLLAGADNGNGKPGGRKQTARATTHENVRQMTMLVDEESEAQEREREQDRLEPDSSAGRTSAAAAQKKPYQAPNLHIIVPQRPSSSKNAQPQPHKENNSENNDARTDKDERASAEEQGNEDDEVGVGSVDYASSYQLAKDDDSTFTHPDDLDRSVQSFPRCLSGCRRSLAVLVVSVMTILVIMVVVLMIMGY